MTRKSLLLFSCKNGSFGDKFVSEIWHGELILSAKMIFCHQREMISPSEKAFAYKMKYEAIKRKAGRRKCGQVDHNLGKKSIELIGEECGDSPKQVQRYIPLQKLPITVGKMAGAVDLLLNDQSVSRLHARISRDGNRFFITDLNSTNGTFRNGMRLEPNASEIIEPGDEIVIGKLKFIYR